MRVNRALEKLRKFFMKRGIDSTTAVIAEQISANSVQAAPVALAKAVTTVAIAKGAAASASTLTLIKGALKIMAWTKIKTAIVTGIVLVLFTGTTVVVTHRSPRAEPRANQPAAPSTIGYSFNFTNVDVRQVLEIYQQIIGVDLSISPEVNRLNASINLKLDKVSKAEAIKQLEQALLEQSRIAITKNGNKATATLKSVPITNPAAPDSPPAEVA
jgi:hypothetical protein